MSSEFSEVLKIMGFGTPLLYATATYSFFHFLDERASDDAKAAISAWFKPLAFDRTKLSAALLEVFDRIYGVPLLSFRAFGRSAILSILVSFAYLFEAGMLGQLKNFDYEDWSSILLFLPILFNVVTDYISLFVIRKWLTLNWLSPVLALVTGMLVGFAIIVAFVYLQAVLTSIAAAQYILQGPFFDDLIQMQTWRVNFWDVLLTTIGVRGHADLLTSSALVRPAFAVFLWLPLLAFGMSFVKLVNGFTTAIKGVQWFLAKGEEHPLEAVAFVAAIVVFCATAIVQHIPGVLS